MKELKNNRVDILGIKIDKITTEEVLDKIEIFLESNRGHYIATVNPEMIIAAQKDEKFQEILNKADISISDGIGILLASKFLSITESNKNILPERISGVDLIYKICQKFQNSNYSIFLLGAKQCVASRAGDRLKKIYPNLKIVGAESGNQNKKIPDSKFQILNFGTIDKEENLSIIKYINQTKASILLVAFGAPKQEKWIAENLEKIPSVKLAIGVGGSFDFISGKIKRAPKFIRCAGLEWLWRFILQPWRAKRIFTATVVFGWKVLRNSSPFSKGD